MCLRPGSNYQGFSLIEVLVAMVVAAVLGVTFLGGQRTAFELAGHSADTWAHINLAQTLLAERSFLRRTQATNAWVSVDGTTDDEVQAWKLSRTNDALSQTKTSKIDGKEIQGDVLDTYRYELQTNVQGSYRSWEWLAE